MAYTPRGIRNNNPGNLQFVGQPGAVLEPRPLDGSKPRFAKFATPTDGLIALRDQLKRYRLRGEDTVNKIMNIYAPSSENNTSAYAGTVAKALGVTPDTKLGAFTPAILTSLMNSIIRVECVQNPYGKLVEDVAYDRIPKPVVTKPPMV